MIVDNSILYRQICGALKATIHSHGAITKKFIPSTAKRVLGNLKKFEKISFPDEPLKEQLIVWANEQHERLVSLRRKIKNPVNNKDKAHIAGKAAELRRLLVYLNNFLECGPDAKIIIDTHRDHK